MSGASSSGIGKGASSKGAVVAAPVPPPRWRGTAAAVLGGMVLLAVVLSLGRARLFWWAGQLGGREALHAVPVENLGGGFRVLPGKTLRLEVPGFDSDLTDGQEFVVEGERFRFEAGGAYGAGWETILRRPMRVYAAAEGENGPRGGWSRIDLGGDPLGGRSPTKDQIYIDPDTVRASLSEGDKKAFEKELGYARLLPEEGEVFRLAHTGFRIQAEVPGLSVSSGGSSRELEVGKPAPLPSGAEISGGGHRLRLALASQVRSEPIADAKGAITGYRPVRESTLLVSIPKTGTSTVKATSSSITWLPISAEPQTYALALDRPNRFYGGDARIHPGGGEVIPQELTDRELMELFREGFGVGRAERAECAGKAALWVDRGFIRALDRHAILARKGELPEAAAGAYLKSLPDRAVYDAMKAEDLECHADYLGRVSRNAGNRVQALLADYNSGLDPGWVALPGTASDWSLEVPGVAPRPALPDGLPEDGVARFSPPAPWAPEKVLPGEERSWSLLGRIPLPAGPDGTALLRLASPLELTVTVDGGPPHPLPLPTPGVSPSIQELLLPEVLPGVHAVRVDALYRGRLEEFGSREEVRPTLGSPGGEISPTRALIGEMPFAEWCQSGEGADAEARSLWREGSQPGDGVVVSYLRFHFEGLAAVVLPFRLATEGSVLEACWNGVPLDVRRAQQVGLLTQEGSNLLAVKVAHRPVVAEEGGGGVRFLWEDGKPVGLSPEVVTRSAQPAVLPSLEDSFLQDSDGKSLPRLVVEAGVPGLPEGTEIPIGERLSGPGRVLLVLPAEGAKGDLLSRPDKVKIRLKPGQEPPIEVMNGSNARLSLFRQMDPFAKPFQPFPGFLIKPGHPEPFRHDRDAIRVGEVWATYRGAPARFARGEVILVSQGRLHRLLTTIGWEVPAPQALPAGEVLVVERDKAGVLSVTVGVSSGGALTRWHGVVPAEGPGLLQWGDRIALPGSGLLLRVAQDKGLLDPRLRPSLGTDTLLRNSPLALNPARPTRLTLDSDLQAAAQEELTAQVAIADAMIQHNVLAWSPGQGGLRGAFVALDAATGEVLAAATATEAVADPAVSPWGLSWSHPGSTFKIVTSLAALQSSDPLVRGMLKGQIPVGLTRAGGRTLAGCTVPRSRPEEGRPPPRGEVSADIPLRSKLDNHKNHPLPSTPNLESALRDSTNTYFGYLSLLMYRPIREGWPHAPSALSGWMEDHYLVQKVARQMGFGEVVDLFAGLDQGFVRRHPVLGEGGRPIAPGDSGYAFTGRFPVEAMEDPQVAASGIGQGEIYTTPFQMARVSAAVATGNRVVPRLVRAYGEDIPAVTPPVPLALSQGDRDKVRGGLRAVVDQGSAKLAFADNPYRGHVFGKTGTSERPGPGGKHVTDSWFTGFIEPPEGSPDSPVAFACVMPGAGLGGTHSAEVIERWLAFLVRYRGWEDGYPRSGSSGDSLSAGSPESLPGN